MNVRPFLIDTAIFKVDDMPEFAYSEKEGVNLIQGTTTPVADDRAGLLTTLSKTNAEVETDDPDP